ncbi:MAG TPA: tryptophan halogenase family protein [Steroidobacteraceae bacterium]|jgi:tryptophan halogenase
MPVDPIRSVAIIGGGTAGWMAATTLSRFFPRLRGGIRLIESADIGTVGVGEATIPPIIEYIRTLGFDENEVARRTQATFKLGIVFNDWTRPGHSYIHPFGPTGLAKRGVPFCAYWHKRAERGAAASLEEYSLQAVGARHGKFMRPVRAANSPLETITYALHLDANLFAAYLRTHAQAQGVLRTEGKVQDVTLRPEDGFIESVTLASGERVAADLYIDCTGFRGLLIEGALKTGYQDWTQWLPCDRAVAVPCERTGPLSSHTLVTARDVGWQWRIPLQHRVGNGYVYSSQFMKDDEAQNILMSGLEGRALRDPLQLRFTTGRRRLSWNKNCVAIGLSAGFLEPLESTGIHLIQRGIFVLLNFFPDRNFRQVDIDRYNRQLAFDYEHARDFIVAHYHLTERPGEFWQHCRATAMPDGLKERVELFRSHGRLLRDDRELFTVQSWFYLLTGQNVQPAGYDPIADSLSDEQAQLALDEVREVVANCAAKMPSHQEFIAENCAAAAG